MDKSLKMKKKNYLIPKANKKQDYPLLLALFNNALEVLLTNIISPGQGEGGGNKIKGINVGKRQ